MPDAGSCSSPSSSPSVWCLRAAELSAQCKAIQRQININNTIQHWITQIDEHIQDNNNKNNNNHTQQQAIQQLKQLQQQYREQQTAYDLYLHDLNLLCFQVRREINTFRQSMTFNSTRIQHPLPLPLPQHTTQQLLDHFSLIESLISDIKQRSITQYISITAEEEQLTQSCTETAQRATQWKGRKQQDQQQQQQHKHKDTELQTETDRHKARGKETDPDGDRSSSLRCSLSSLDAELLNLNSKLSMWSTAQHNVFLSLFYSCPTDSLLLSKLSLALPEETQQAIREHLRVFRMIQHIRQQRKEIITQWKQNKQQSKQRAEKEQSKYVNAAMDSNLDVKHEYHKRPETRAAVARWKLQKDAEEKQATTEKEEKEALERRKQQMKHLSHASELKLSVAAWMSAKQAKQKEQETQKQVQSEQEQMTHEMSKKEARRVHMERTRQQLVLVQQQRQRAEEEHKQEQARQQRLLLSSQQVVGVVALRDRSRLSTQTESASARAAETDQQRRMHKVRTQVGKQAFLLTDAISQHALHVPAWRQGVA